LLWRISEEMSLKPNKAQVSNGIYTENDGVPQPQVRGLRKNKTCKFNVGHYIPIINLLGTTSDGCMKPDT
jgi:hypothetical protein